MEGKKGQAGDSRQRGDPYEVLGLSQGVPGHESLGSLDPLGCQDEPFPRALEGHVNPPRPAEKAFFLRLATERTVAPSLCPLPTFPPWWGRKEEKEPRKARKETVTVPIPQIAIIWGPGEGGLSSRETRGGGRSPAACAGAEKFPFLFKYY